MCAEREGERETEREPRAANGRRRSEGQASAREKESKRDRTPQGWREREEKNALQSNGRLFDALPLVVVRVLVGDGDDVLFSSPLPFSHCISLSLSFALHATSGLSSHTTLPILLTTTRFFFAVLLFFSLQKDQRQRHTM